MTRPGTRRRGRDIGPRLPPAEAGRPGASGGPDGGRTARVWASRRPLSYDAPVPIADELPPSRRPREVPCPTSARSVRSATIRRPSPTCRSSSHRRTTSSTPPSASGWSPGTRPTSCGSTCPAEETGDEPDDRYRRAARVLAAWRSDGTLHKDPHPSIYVYEQTYRVPGTDVTRTQRGFFARIRLEPYGPESGVLPHERTMSAPREDRYKLLRATGVNTSPVVGLYEDPDGTGRAVLDVLTGRAPDVEVTDDDGTCHRLWAVAADGDAGRRRRSAARRRVGRPGDDRRRPPSLRDRVALPGRAPDVAIVRGGPGVRLHADAVPRRRRRAADRPADPPDRRRSRRRRCRPAAGGSRRRSSRSGATSPTKSCADRSAGRAWRAAARAGSGSGRGPAAALLTARRTAFEPFLPDGGGALRGLDVTLLGVALERLAGIDADAVAAGAVAYTKSADEAIDRVDAGLDGADAAFLLEPTPVASISAVALDGDVMPQKSTYFYPKALTGLVINPLEW